jgi:hypothetical protein
MLASPKGNCSFDSLHYVAEHFALSCVCLSQRDLEPRVVSPIEQVLGICLAHLAVGVQANSQEVCGRGEGLYLLLVEHEVIHSHFAVAKNNIVVALDLPNNLSEFARGVEDISTLVRADVVGADDVSLVH